VLKPLFHPPDHVDRIRASWIGDAIERCGEEEPQ